MAPKSTPKKAAPKPAAAPAKPKFGSPAWQAMYNPAAKKKAAAK